MMNPEFVFVGETATRDEVLPVDALARTERRPVDTIVLLDADAKFSGTVPVAPAAGWRSPSSVCPT